MEGTEQQQPTKKDWAIFITVVCLEVLFLVVMVWKACSIIEARNRKTHPNLYLKK